AILEKYAKTYPMPQMGLEAIRLRNRMTAETLIHQSTSRGRQYRPLNVLIRETEEEFVARTLYYAIAFYSQMHLHENGIDHPPLQLWELVLTQLQSGAWKSSPLIQLYYHMFLLVRLPSDSERYQHAKALLTKHGPVFPKSERMELYTIVLNRCIGERNRGNPEADAEIFHLYMEMLDRDLLIGESGMDGWHFKTIVACALRLGKLEEARAFVEMYAAVLRGDLRENILDYCRGMIAFQESDFREAERHMNSVLVHFKDPFFGLDVRAWLLRIYYETGNESGMDALTESFRMFLVRHHHLSPKRLENYHVFVRFFRRLRTLPLGRSTRAAKLQKDIRDSPWQAARSMSRKDTFHNTKQRSQKSARLMCHLRISSSPWSRCATGTKSPSSM
ncbi:MAG: hypothetical protein AAF570_26550, partial [Bacteroidota bacterium]